LRFVIDALISAIDDVFAKTDALRVVIAEEFDNNVLRFIIDALISAIDDVFANTDALRIAMDKLMSSTDKLKDVLKVVT
jgi:hypothetical protein